ncbi:MAG: FkbM family methyltransferase [Cystobacterineae bacterium]|nr:FkbM family methyltransferase [Cystobacterineae bacterium]
MSALNNISKIINTLLNPIGIKLMRISNHMPTLPENESPHLKLNEEKLTLDNKNPSELHQARVGGFIECLKSLTDDSFIEVEFNGIQVLWPRYTLLTMRHCLHFKADGSPYFLVETAHWERMRNWLNDGTVFLDIGAATGAMCIPFDLSVNKNIRLFAFEPSVRARNYLERTLAKNQCRRIKSYPYAISDVCGSAEFVEMPFELDGVPYLPETSSLSTVRELCEGANKYTVEIRTLDSLLEEMQLSESDKAVIKIDVEGFETEVLRGAQELIKRLHPRFAIDIHLKPGMSSETTEEEVKQILGSFNYHFEHLDHVVLAV